MLREITKQLGKRLQPGDVHDYPRDVWLKIAADGKTTLDAFSKAIAHNPALQSPLKGRLHQHKRLGT